jgi:hypothetical protein
VRDFHVIHMDADDLKEEKIRNLFSECLKLKLEILKVFLTFTSISVGLEIFIMSNSYFDIFNLKIWGLTVVFIFVLWMGLYLKGQMDEVDARYLGF